MSNQSRDQDIQYAEGVLPLYEKVFGKDAILFDCLERARRLNAERPKIGDFELMYSAERHVKNKALGNGRFEDLSADEKTAYWAGMACVYTIRGAGGALNVVKPFIDKLSGGNPLTRPSQA